MDFPVTLRSARLRLRLPGKADAPAVLARWAGDPEVTRYLVWKPHADIGSVEQYIERCECGRREQREVTWLICEGSDNAPIGAIALRVAGHRAEMGYVLGRTWWGRGYMTEVVRRVTEECFRSGAIFRVGAYCDVENLASARVMEKAGMTREGLLRGWAIHPNVSLAPRDCWCYAMVITS